MKSVSKQKNQKRARKFTGYKATNEETAHFIFGARNPKAGVQVTKENATQLSAFYCGALMLMNSVGSMPIHMYKRLVAGKERVTKHPVARAFGVKPNNFMTPMEFKSLMMNHIIFRGDFFAHIMQTNGGDLHLIPLDPDRTSVSIDSNYQLFYAYEDPSGSKIPFEQDEIFHVKGQFSDGLRGMSVIKAAREGLSRAMAADEHASEFYANNSIPAGVLEYPQVLKKQDIDRLRDTWEKQHKGTGNRHRIAILEQGMTWKALGLSNSDQQWLEGRQHEIEEIARWLNIPPHKLKHLLRATFSNIEHQGKEYHEDSVQPHTKRISESITAKFFTEPGEEDYFAEFLFDSLLITDTLTRYLAHKHAIDSGWKTRNEVRAIENLNPLDGLDTPLEPLNMAPAGSQDETAPSGSSDEEIEKQRNLYRAAFHRVFEDAFSKIRSRETKKWEEFRKKGLEPEALRDFYRKIEEFIPEALDAVAISWGEVCGVTLSDVRSVVSTFASGYFNQVSKDMRAEGLPDLPVLVNELMDTINDHKRSR